MKKFIFACSLVLCLSTFTSAQTSEEAKAALKQLTEYRQQIFTEARTAGKPLSAQEIKDKVDAKAQETLDKIDPSKIEAKNALDWARVFEYAGRNKDVCDLAKKYLTTNPDDKDRFQAMYLMAQACNAQGEADMLAMTLKDIPVPDAGASMTIGNMTANVYVDTIFKKQGLESAIDTLDSIQSKLVVEDPKDYAKRTLESQKTRIQGGANIVDPKAGKTDEERLKALEAQGAQVNDNQLFTFANKRAELYKKSGKDKEAADELNKFLSTILPTSPVYRRAKMALTQMSLESYIAPSILSERSYGEFKGLDSLKGKVVIVDFFAHWCGPCIASFPDMQQMYSDLREKGLEVVAVTTYYGYYKKENVEKRDMAKDAEFAKMSEFIAEHKLPWPVVYGERANFEAYGVSGIPTTAVVGRDGRIHKIHVGYSKATFSAFRKEIEKLLGEGR